MEDKRAQITGTVSRITYFNEKNHYTVLRLDTSEGQVTAVGTFPAVNPGQELLLTGEWRVHPRYGIQFHVESHRPLAPVTLEGLERYLSSGLIKGIGPVFAKRLVSRFGLDTLKVIQEAPERLAEIPGLGEQRRKNLVEAVAAHQAVQDIMVFLQGLGVGPTLAARIYKEYGSQATDVLQRDPYRLANEVHGIGFHIADRLARAVGIGADSIERAQAAVMYLLEQAEESGHVCLPFASLLEEGQKELSISADRLQQAVQNLAATGRLVVEADTPERLVYSARLHWIERRLAELLVSLAQVPRASELPLVEPDCEQDEQGVHLSPEQWHAVKEALRGGVVVITGGPGTGKTTVVREIIRSATARGATVLLAAPTGRAAKRLQEATGMRAMTIHRLLEYGPNIGDGRIGFQKNADNPLRTDMLVIDEVSMLDLPLAYHLLSAVKPGTTLVMVGDADQLPSVGPGTVLQDIIQSARVPVVRLTRVFRQARESMIVVNAHRINRGEHPIYNRSDGDFFLVEEKEPEAISKRLRELVVERLPRYLECDPHSDIQVLSPIRRGAAGVEHLNNVLQSALNPAVRLRPDERLRGLYPGDRVMQVRNNYDKLVFNGDIGLVKSVDRENASVVVVFSDREEGSDVVYEEDELEELSLAYAMSVHKSQGSEFPIVVLALPRVMPELMTRNLLYTAVTRAQRFVVLVGLKSIVGMYIANDKAMHRYGRLVERLQTAAQHR
ncbi:MAG: ATP-dependent RecD-like DNA helicase [Firmicutes bacterium]|nr:ATP-dependent RecD-like DNA helicase [Bacillota bacterium]